MRRLNDILKRTDKLKEFPDHSLTEQNENIQSLYGFCFKTVTAVLAPVKPHEIYKILADYSQNPDLIITENAITNIHHAFIPEEASSKFCSYRTEPLDEKIIGYAVPVPEEVPRFMGHLCDQIVSSSNALHPVELAAMVYRRFMDIHPFDFYNESTALVLMNLILIKSGYGAVCIPHSQRVLFEQTLKDSRTLSNLEPFTEITAECFIRFQTCCRELLNIR